MLKLNTVFTDKIIISGIEEKKIKKFLTFLLERFWIHSEIPGAVRKVKQASNPSIAALYEAVDVDKLVDKMISKGVVSLSNIGPIELGLKVRVNIIKNVTTPSCQIEVDKFVFERDGRKDLKKSLLAIINEWNKLDV